MEERKIYNTLRVRYNDELKLFPSSKVVSLDDLKEKVITRYDLLMKKEHFDLEYFDWDQKGVLVLENVSGTNKINETVINKLISQKIELQIVKKQLYEQKELKKKFQEDKKSQLKQRQFESLQSQLDEFIPNKKVQKHYAQCDKCFAFPILGIRYKCIICEDYDLCQKCHTRLEQEKGPKCHPYMKIRRPVQKIEAIRVEFKQTDMQKMYENCRQDKSQQKVLEKDFSKLQIDQSSLPHKTVVSKNFVEELFSQECANRKYKTHPSIEGAYGQSLAIDSCS